MGLCLALLVFIPFPAFCQTDWSEHPDEVGCPRVDTKPTLDGRLDDPCWGAAAVIDRFSRPLSTEAPEKPVRALVCFDDEALYVGVVCSEPQPERIKTGAADGGTDVWKDDCVEVFVRTTDSGLEFDQFILNAAGARQSNRVRVGTRTEWRPMWRGAARIGKDAWTAEIVVPFSDLGIETPTDGYMAELKLGREDHTTPAGRLSVWPPRAPYGGNENYGRLYFGNANLLANPDMSRQEGGDVVAWSFDEKDRPSFSSVRDGERQVIRWRTPGRYSTTSQSLRLKPNSTYRLRALLRGTAGVYLRARTSERKGSVSRRFDVQTKPSEEYVPYDVAFPTGEEGTTLIIIGNTEGLGVGEVSIAGLQVVRAVGHQDAGPPIPLAPGRMLYLTDVPVADCRALRGFVGGPVDGRLDSYAWNGATWEYGMRGAGSGVYYTFNNGDGLHVKLADKSGVDAVQIRNGARVKLYRDCTSYFEPGEGVLVWDFPTGAKNSRALFEPRVMSDSFSFFELKDGYIADVSFLRIGEEGVSLPEPASLVATAPTEAPDIAPFVSRRFGEDEQATFALEPGGRAMQLQAKEREFLHFVTDPLPDELPLLAVGVRLRLPGAPTGLPISVRVQDPFNPRIELMGADVAAEAGGDLHVVLDHRDQIVPGGKRVWVSVQLGAPATIESVQVELYAGTRQQALPEALAYRKLILKGVFGALSEPRPWTGFRRRDMDLDAWARTRDIGPLVVELVRCAEFCAQLGPNDHVARQYHTWLWRTADLDPYEPEIDDVPGAPEWAVVARQAWLTAREVPRWWLENRVVPTGEFGGRIGDDSDMYQNYANFPMISDDSVSRQLTGAAASLAELAEEDTLEEGLNKRTMDPLHAYEEGVNHEAVMVLWDYGDPVYLERCMIASRSMPAVTVMTPRGHRHFKSQELGAEDLRIDRPTDTDGHAHPLMLHPCFEVAWYNRSPRLVRFLREWADGWLEHQQPGDYATGVEVATEKATDRRQTRPLYGGYGGQASAFMFLYFVTGDAKYLRPFMDFYAKGEAPQRADRSLPELYHSGALDGVGDALPRLAERHSILRTLVSGDKGPMIEALKGDIAEVQRFKYMYTEAEQFTDRIFLRAINNAALCYTGGYATRNKYDHHYACSWEGLGTDFAALVLIARPDHFKAIVYSFAAAPLEGRLRLWTLDHGTYRFSVGPDTDGDDIADSVAAQREVEVMRATAIPITLSPRQTTVIELRQTRRLEPIYGRPDLALSPLDTRVEGTTVNGVLHNIGSAAVERCELVLQNAAGEIVKRQTLGPVAAPGDLTPVRVQFTFGGLPRDASGWRVAVDPDDAIAEIYEGNNAISLAMERRETAE